MTIPIFDFKDKRTLAMLSNVTHAQIDTVTDEETGEALLICYEYCAEGEKLRDVKKINKAHTRAIISRR